MIGLDLAAAAEQIGAKVLSQGSSIPAESVSIDSREVSADQLFFGLVGSNRDGGEFAPAVAGDACWGIVARPEWAARALEARGDGEPIWILAAEDPTHILQRLAQLWRRELGAKVVAITGSTGKTSVKDICHSLLPARVHASRENFNTEIGMPMSILAAPADTEVMVLEMGMRGRGQIAELCEIAEPDVALISNIGPVHLELLGSIEAVAATKAEILAGLNAGGWAILPANEPLLEPHLKRIGDGVEVLTFGPGGDVEAFRLDSGDSVPGEMSAELRGPDDSTARFDFPFDSAHNLTNATAAVATGLALGFDLEEMSRRAPGVTFSRLRGERIDVAGEVTLINDCYNANPISVDAALRHLASMGVPGRRVAALGGMAELGPTGPTLHADAGALVRELGIDHLLGIGELARDYAPDQWHPDPQAAAAELDRWLEPGDVVLVKGSRSVGLEKLAEELIERRGLAGEPSS